MKNITVLGAGHGGCALAGILSLNGNKVCLYADPHHANNLYAIQKNKGVKINGIFNTFVEIARTTTDIRTAVEYSEIIFLALPSFAQEEIFKRMLPYLSVDQTIIILQGNFASFPFLKLSREYQKELIFVESNTFPYASRTHRTGEVYIYGSKKRMGLASYPATKITALIEEISPLFTCELYACSNIIETGLSTINPLPHVITSLLNAGWIESSQGEFYFHKEGMSPAICKVIERLDVFRIMLGEQYNIQLKPLISLFNHLYDMNYHSFYDLAKNSDIHNSFKGTPKDLNYRYITEDVPYLFVPWYFLSAKAKLESSLLKGIIDIASTINQVDYLMHSRNLETMGISSMTPKEILDYISG